MSAKSQELKDFFQMFPLIVSYKLPSNESKLPNDFADSWKNYPIFKSTSLDYQMSLTGKIKLIP